MIKSIVNKKEVLKTISYPILMVGPYYKEIVLFIKPGTGICLTHRDKFGGDYYSCQDLSQMALFDGEVTLSNMYLENTKND